MNKDLRNQIPADEQSMALRIDSLVEDMQPSQAFQWNLENQLMDKATTPPAQSWLTKIMIPIGWAIAAIGGVLLLNWALRTFVPQAPLAAGPTETQEVSFTDRVRSGTICTAPLALAHGFDVFLTNEDKTGFVPVDTGNALGELDSFAWSADGEQLAVVGNTTGSGNIYLTDPTGRETGYLLLASGAGYLRGAAWSRDGKQLILWSSQNMTTLYQLSALGHGLIEKQLNVQILGTPQFTPDGHIIYYGVDGTAAGLFLMTQESSEPFLLMPEIEGESSFAFSPDGSLLAYMEYDHEKGEARLSTQKLSKGEYRLLGTLFIPKGSGSSVPNTANLSWSPDGQSLVFDFGRNSTDHVIYLARTNGSGLIKVADSAYAPSISADGNCLAYIRAQQVFLLDLRSVSANSTTATPILLADLPAGRGTPNFKQDKLQWSPQSNP